MKATRKPRRERGEEMVFTEMLKKNPRKWEYMYIRDWKQTGKRGRARRGCDLRASRRERGRETSIACISRLLRAEYLSLDLSSSSFFFAFFFFFLLSSREFAVPKWEGWERGREGRIYRRQRVPALMLALHKTKPFQFFGLFCFFYNKVITSGLEIRL